MEPGKRAELKTLIYAGKPVGQFEESGDLRKDAEQCREILKSLGLYKPPTEVEAMHTQAFAFATAAARIHDTLLQEEKSFAGLSTFVVNAAFAIEVYLKALTKCFGGTVNKNLHNLKDLLSELPKDAQMAIRMQMPFVLGPVELAEKYDLAAIMQNLNKAFIEWRYLYEDGNKAEPVHIPHVIYALRVLHSASHNSIIGPIQRGPVAGSR